MSTSTSILGEHPLNVAYQFPAIGPADYQAQTGLTPPAFDRNRGEQDWYDPNAIANQDDSGMVSYPATLAQNSDGSPASDPVSGLPYLKSKPYTMPAVWAAVPNFFTGTRPAPKAPVPFPLDLTKVPAGYVLAWSSLPVGKLPVWRDTTPPAPSAPVAFSQSDRDAIIAIKAKLGA